VEELWKNCRKILRLDDSSKKFPPCAAVRGPTKSFYNFSTILPQFFPAARACKMFLQFFHNSSLFGASGLAWGRIVEGKIVEELWKYLVNPVPGNN
jgi:hypothetical protein